MHVVLALENVVTEPFVIAYHVTAEVNLPHYSDALHVHLIFILHRL